MYYLKGKRDILLTNFYFCAQIFREVKVWSRTLVGAKQFYRSKINLEIKLSRIEVGFQYEVSCVYFLRPIFSH